MTNRASNPAAVDLLEHEFAQERASALGRLGRAFEAALAALREFDLRMANPEPSPVERELRAALVEEGKHCPMAFRRSARCMRAAGHAPCAA
jgi:hypothetical protein